MTRRVYPKRSEPGVFRYSLTVFTSETWSNDESEAPKVLRRDREGVHRVRL
jgi:hypothetical protein